MTMQFGLTSSAPCGYLPDQQERLAVMVEDAQQATTPAHYQLLLERGFRRSHNDLYRPWCDHCQACQSLRVDVAGFQPSRSQKRVLAKNQDLELTIGGKFGAEQQALFCDFINQRHQDGAMYPPQPDRFLDWVSCDWLDPVWLQWHSNETLVAVAVCDRLPQALSAMYTFFDPAQSQRSLGTFCVLKQLELAKQWQIPWLYLGYQIDDCQKMNYKAKFKPNERYIGNRWEKELKS
ncbi:arginine-tRNA-protein transferase [Pseudidiomarina planktonica]|uniref:Aspartate/glutamate leucyltransferase n=1 Tax=Pseudidiomarina planktonica TaxID=1323738 RepID=A0A1Y6EUE0_9GAMM|nr:arginyltransferase [Pseudidiomarina planktonica]SMQ65916.1 arginine-tRNA-protein transferase [Pseudidiomarina planktonica]